ncbi:MAG: hypothetical protein R3B96_23685 [Pirellulaceae bacterium]|nr:hypothetical protein [Planctomycetales bacterium]
MSSQDPQSFRDRTRKLNADLSRMNEQVSQFVDGLTFYWAFQDEELAMPIGPEQRRAIEYASTSDLIFGVIENEAEDEMEIAPEPISDEATRTLRLRQLVNRARKATHDDGVGQEAE